MSILDFFKKDNQPKLREYKYFTDIPMNELFKAGPYICMFSTFADDNRYWGNLDEMGGARYLCPTLHLMGMEGAEDVCGCLELPDEIVVGEESWPIQIIGKPNMWDSVIFSDLPNVTSIKFPKQTVRIFNSFTNLPSLRDLDFPPFLQVIYHSFTGCPELRHLHFPVSFREARVWPFEDCTKIESVQVDGDLPAFDWEISFDGSYTETATVLGRTTMVSKFLPLWPEALTVNGVRLWFNEIPVPDFYCEGLGSTQLLDIERKIADGTLKSMRVIGTVPGHSHIDIPETFEFRGIIYPVTDLDTSMIISTPDWEWGSISSIRIPEGCHVNYLADILSAGPANAYIEFPLTPPDFNNDDFGYNELDFELIELRVPTESIGAYRAHPVWGQFKNIVSTK